MTGTITPGDARGPASRRRFLRYALADVPVVAAAGAAVPGVPRPPPDRPVTVRPVTVPPVTVPPVTVPR
jgi:hypothetical protein